MSFEKRYVPRNGEPFGVQQRKNLIQSKLEIENEKNNEIIQVIDELDNEILRSTEAERNMYSEMEAMRTKLHFYESTLGHRVESCENCNGSGIINNRFSGADSCRECEGLKFTLKESKQSIYVFAKQVKEFGKKSYTRNQLGDLIDKFTTTGHIKN